MNVLMDLGISVVCYIHGMFKKMYRNLFFVERDPNSSLPPPLIGGYRPTVFGEEPPENEGYDELCPKRVCPDCKRMHALRCEGSAKMYGLTILPYDTNFPGLPNRTGSKLIFLSLENGLEFLDLLQIFF